MSRVEATFCRLCTAYCPIQVEIKDGRPVRVTGDREAPLYGGYTCVKGRALPQIHSDPDRLLYSLRRNTAGEFEPLGSDEAITEIASKLEELKNRYGPRSVALYMSTPSLMYPATARMGAAFMGAFGSPLIFSSVTIDQPGLNVANALHGEWGGGRISHDTADLILFAGGNPVISKQYLSQNPARKLKDRVNAGAKLIVIDPRKTETARRAHLHLKVRPGQDAAVLAGLVHLLFENDALDHDFLKQNASRVQALHEAVRPFNPKAVAARAGISEEDLTEAASLIAASQRGYFGGGTGLGMSGFGNLTFYLLLCLQTLRGFWARDGEPFSGSSVLTPPRERKAQAYSPIPAILAEKLSVTGLPMSVAGLPTSALPDEILSSGEFRIRALICLGNPIACWPDSAKAEQAMRALDLLVVPNVEMSGVTRLADYVIATKNIMETPATTQFMESVRPTHPGYGWEAPYAYHTPALLPPPPDSDLIEEWQFFYRLARNLGLQIDFLDGTGLSMGESSQASSGLDMGSEPTTEEVFDFLCQGSAVPLEDVRKARRPRLYPEAQQFVRPRDEGWSDRLQLADRQMLDDLAAVRHDKASEQSRYPFLLIPRRADHVLNSAYRRLNHKRKYNPAFMHSDDIESIGSAPGDRVTISSVHGSIEAIIDSDDDLRRGVVSITHAFGADPGSPDNPAEYGSNVNFLLSMVDGRDAITGMPRMAAVPVAVSATQS